MKSVSIIIVNYNLTENVRSLLHSINQFVTNIDYEVLVVDNNSPDRSIEKLASEFPQFRFEFLDTNYGFGHGNNIAVSLATGKYLLLLNPDTYLVENLPLRLFKFAETHPDFGIIGPKMIFPDGRFQVSTAKFPSFKQEIGNLSGLSVPLLNFINFVKFRVLKKRCIEVDYIFGSCMMINTQLYKELNGFDEDYFLFSEEMDLCYRTWKNTRYKVVYYLNEKIVHIKSLITGNNLPLRMKLGYDSKLKFFKKHYSAPKIFVIKNIIVTMIILKYITLFRKKRNKNDYKKAYSDIIKLYLKNSI